MMRKLDLPHLLGRTASRERDLALAVIASRLIALGSKLTALRALAPETSSSSLGHALDLGAIEEREVYAALDWTPGARTDPRIAPYRRETRRMRKRCMASPVFSRR
jgi:hypothetical protein